jgi:hypothetical protein
VKIYPTEFSIPNINAGCMRSAETLTYQDDHSYGHQRLDLENLSKTLDKMDQVAIRKRKATFNRLYHEAIISHRPGIGISFTDTLLLLAHHKFIVDADALV